MASSLPEGNDRTEEQDYEEELDKELPSRTSPEPAEGSSTFTIKINADCWR